MTDAERYAYDEHINAVMIQNDVLGNARQEGLEEGRAESRAEGRAVGRAEGELSKSQEIARNLLGLGMPVPQIMQATGLTQKQIEQLEK